jgi:uncharacterized protein YkuJ
MKLLRQNLSFEDQRAYGLDIPRRLHLHTRGNIKHRKYFIVQGVDICKIAWYKIVGVFR